MMNGNDRNSLFRRVHLVNNSVKPIYQFAKCINIKFRNYPTQIRIIYKNLRPLKKPLNHHLCIPDRIVGNVIGNLIKILDCPLWPDYFSHLDNRSLASASVWLWPLWMSSIPSVTLSIKISLSKSSSILNWLDNWFTVNMTFSLSNIISLLNKFKKIALKSKAILRRPITVFAFHQRVANPLFRICNPELKTPLICLILGDKN